MSRALRRIWVRYVPARLKFLLKTAQYRLAPRPMMSREERAFVRALLQTGAYRRVVEIGAGGSTLYFPRFLPEGGRWTALEFHEDWYRFLRRRADPRVELLLARGTEDLPALLAQADLVLVDGGPDRARCLGIVAESGTPALVLLHDARRPRYASAKARFAREIVLTREYGVERARAHDAGGLSILVPQ